MWFLKIRWSSKKYVYYSNFANGLLSRIPVHFHTVVCSWVDSWSFSVFSISNEVVVSQTSSDRKMNGNNFRESISSAPFSNIYLLPVFQFKIVLKHYGGLAFQHAAPKLCNSFPDETRPRCTTVTSFKTNIKTYLFNQVYN